MNLCATQRSLDITRQISDRIQDRTFHHHYHVLHDIAHTYAQDHHVQYLEIGCYAGGSACLMLQRPRTAVTTVDLGWPVTPQTVHDNVAALNHCRNDFRYVQGDSHDPATIQQVSDRRYDIIFIDGDHSYHGVWQDFEAYRPLLKPGGYLVFDDYLDHEHSPSVRSAVDHIVNQVRQDFDVIGCLSNSLGARPPLSHNNCFVLRQRNSQTGPDIAVTVATYRRGDGSTPKLLRRALDSVMSQTHMDWHVFLVGDRYDRPQEIQELLQQYPAHKITWKNLAVADERDHCTDPAVLWRTGGVTAFNTAIEEALMAGHAYIAHLDHDDVWEPAHLQEIVQAISLTGASWICTRAQHFDGQILPRLINCADHIVPFTPVYSSVIHSSVCMDFRAIPLRYRNLWKLNNDQSRASDSDMWERCRRYILDHGLRSVAINRVTCLHQQEQG